MVSQMVENFQLKGGKSPGLCVKAYQLLAKFYTNLNSDVGESIDLVGQKMAFSVDGCR